MVRRVVVLASENVVLTCWLAADLPNQMAMSAGALEFESAAIVPKVPRVFGVSSHLAEAEAEDVEQLVY